MHTRLLGCTKPLVDFDSFPCFSLGVMHMCATRKWRNWRVTMLPIHPGETDPSRSHLHCLRGWRMACLLKERRHSGWRWSWRMENWTLSHIESNTQRTIGLEMNGTRKPELFYHFTCCHVFQCVICFSSFSIGVSTPPMTTPTACVTLLRISHTHSVPKSSSPGKSEFFGKLL